MTSAIHYKVKSGGVGAAAGGGGGGGGWQSIHFDGVYLACHELKRRIIYNEGWCTNEHDANFDLQVSNSSSGEEYREDQYSVHRNVSVLVKRVPAASPAAGRRLFIAPGSLGPDWNKSTSTWVPPGMQDAAAAAADGNPLLGRSASGEEGDIAAMIQARGSYSASGGRGGRSGPFQQTFNTRTLTPSSRPPSGYICHRCKQGGHFINFCPTNGDQAYDQARRGATTREDREREREREKERVNNSLSYGERDYGSGGSRHVPVSATDTKPSQWLKPVEDPKALQAELDGGVAHEKETVHRAQRMFPSQFFAGNPAAQLPHSNKPLLAPELTTFLPAYFDAASSSAAASAPAASAGTAATPAAASVPAPPLRADLTCTLCKDYFLAASVLGCCFTSFCLECIQAHFKTSSACPSCASTDVTAEDVQPNVNLQKAVDQFLLEHPSIVRGAIKQQLAAAAEAANNQPPTPASGAPSYQPSLVESRYGAPATSVAPAAPYGSQASSYGAPSASLGRIDTLDADGNLPPVASRVQQRSAEAAYERGGSNGGEGGHGGQNGGGGGGGDPSGRPAGGHRRGCFTCGGNGHSAKYCPTTGGPGGPGDPGWKGRRPAHQSQGAGHMLPSQQAPWAPQASFAYPGMGAMQMPMMAMQQQPMHQQQMAMSGMGGQGLLPMQPMLAMPMHMQQQQAYGGYNMQQQQQYQQQQPQQYQQQPQHQSNGYGSHKRGAPDADDSQHKRQRGDGSGY